MCAAQVTPLKDAFPSLSSTPGTVYPQCRWVSTKAPLKQVAHIQNGRLLPTQRRLLPIPAYLRRDIVGHAVGAESGSLLTLWCWVSPANSSSSRAHENKNRAENVFCLIISPGVFLLTGAHIRPNIVGGQRGGTLTWVGGHGYRQ